MGCHHQSIKMRALYRQLHFKKVQPFSPLSRLEKLAEDIESEYKRFDSWREKCDNMNQWLSESEKLIKNEEKIGSDIGVLQEQIKDNQVRSF